MTDVIALSGTRRASPGRIRIGLLRLTDSAPVIVAHEFGFFADEGLEVDVSVEPSWANIADKLGYGFLDAAVILPPLAFAIALGLRGAPQPVLVPYVLSLGGNTVTLARDLAEEVRAAAAHDGQGIAQAFARIIGRSDAPPTMAVVHAYSTHNLLLRYWLATAGIMADRDVRLVVIPPERMVEALTNRLMIGFCAGAPWGEVAARAKIGATIAASHDIWRCAPEKAFAVREDLVERNPDCLPKLLRALFRAGEFCDAPENASYTAALLAKQKYLNVDSHAILSSLPGNAAGDNVSVFHRQAATYPWRSHALWFLTQMARWQLIDAQTPLREIAAKVYRPDLYGAALASAGASIPDADMKVEGAHTTHWSLPAVPSAIAMQADNFCDGAIFDPARLEMPALALAR